MAAVPPSPQFPLSADELEKTLHDAGVQSPAVLAQQLISAMATQIAHQHSIAIGAAREAYREGFLLGRVTPRFVPFSAQMWRSSKIFQRLQSRDVPSSQSSSRYANPSDW